MLPAEIWEISTRHARDEEGLPCSPLHFVLRLAAGRFKVDPFSDEAKEEVRTIVKDRIGIPDERCTVPENQPFRLGMVRDLLRAAGDPDWAFFDDLVDGVALGVDETMPRTPAVFEEKAAWKLAPWDEDNETHENPNYASVSEHAEAVEALFREEAAMGWMEERTDEAAKAEFGDRLFVAALAVVVEPNKLRVVHDGSHVVQVNNRIRPRDQIRSPGAGELRTRLRALATDG